MEWFLIYLLVMTEQIRDAAASYSGWIAGGIFITAIVGFFGFMYWVEGSDADEVRAKHLKKVRNLLFFYWFITFCLALVHTLLPTQKNMAIIVGTGITYSAVTSETGQRIGGKAVQLLEQKINEALEDKTGGQEKEGKKEESPPQKSGGKVSSQAT